MPSSLSQVAVHKMEILLFFTLLQLAVIIAAARVGGEIAKRFRQSVAVGEIIVGILLGPSLLGKLAPDTFHFIFRSAMPEPFQIMSQIGLILLMFQVGLEFDFSHLAGRDSRAATLRVAAASLLLPFLLGFAFGFYSAPSLSPMANRTISALFVATAFSITALPILGRIMIEFDISHTPLGVIAISAAAINDVVGWILLALITALATSEFEAVAFGWRILLIVSFFLLSWLALRPLMKLLVRRSFEGGGGLSNNLLGVLLAAVFLSAMATFKLGIFAIFGGFMMGVILYDEHALREAWRERVGHFVAVFFLPVFFTFTGLRTNIGVLENVAAWGWCVLAVLLATLGKFGGAYAAARWSGIDHYAASSLGIMMNTRALMELIIINVGYDLGVISQDLFTMLVIMAVASTVVTTPCLRLWLPRSAMAGRNG